MHSASNRGRAASIAPNRGRLRGRVKPGLQGPFNVHVNAQTADVDLSRRKGQQQGKHANNGGRLGPIRQNNALNHSLDELLPGNDDEYNPHSTSKVKSQTLDERAARFSAHANSKKVHYEELKKLRAQEREIAIAKGLIDDPDKPRNLEDAIQFVGTCQDMCPQFERLERELQHGLDNLEKDDQGNADPAKCVKTYRRSAAGNEQPLPSDVRPAPVLERTLDYLFNVVLGTNALEDCHVFIRDRTRAVRKDFGVQNIVNIDAVRAHERIARFHILSLHEMCELEEEKFSEQQENEQLRKVLVSLAQYYDDLSKVGIYSDNEPEFRAYQILTYIRDQDTIRWAQTLRLPVFTHPLVQRALEIHALAQRNNEIPGNSRRRNKPNNCEAAQNFFTRFFKLVADKDTTFLMACMLEGHFPDIRKGALKAMNKAYHAKYSGLSAETVQKMLAYDSIEDCVKEAEYYGIPVNYTGPIPTIQFSTATWDGTKQVRFLEHFSNPKAKKSRLLVEPKKAGMTFSQIISKGLGSSNAVPRPSRPSSAIPIVRPPPTTYFDKPKITQSFTIPSVKASVALPMVAKPKMAVSAPVTVATPVFNGQVKPGFFARANVEAMEQKYKPALASLSDAEKLKAQQDADERTKTEEQAAREKREAAEKARIEEENRRQEVEKARKLAEVEAARAAEAERKRQLAEARKRAEEEAAIAKRKADEAAHVKILAQTRKMAIVSQLQHQICNELIQEILEQQVTKIAYSRYFELKGIKRVVDVWRVRTKNKIAERKRAEQRLEKIRHTISRMRVANPSTIASSDEPMTDATSDGTSSDDTTDTDMTSDAYEDIESYSQQLIRDMEKEAKWRDQLWQKEDFSQTLYRTLMPALSSSSNDKTSPPPNWQLLLCVESWNSQPAQWIRRKFDMDGVTGVKHVHHPQLDVTFQSVAYDADIDRKLLVNTGAIIFQLSDVRHSDAGDLENTKYWTQEKTRFHSFMRNVHKSMPQLRLPVVILYWPLQPGLGDDLKEKIPLLLNIYTTSVASDHRVVIMTPQNACEELPEAIQWLGQNGRKPSQLIKALKPEVAMQKFWEVMNWNMSYVYQQLSQIPTTVEQTVQGINQLISTHNKTMEQLAEQFGDGICYEHYILPDMKPRSFAGRTVTRADLYLMHTEWLSQIKFQLPHIDVPSSPQDMCQVFAAVSGRAFHVIQNKLVA